MALDQGKGTGTKGPSDGGATKKIGNYRKNAMLGRLVVIASVLYRNRNDRDRLLELLRLFYQSDGFENFLKGPRSPRNWLKKLRAENELKLVCDITSYICRYKQHGAGSGNGGVGYAREFVAKQHPGVTSRVLEKYWATKKQAAPYIFSLYPWLWEAVRSSASVDDLVDRLEGCSTQKGDLARYFGIAAWVADVLMERKVRDVRIGRFQEYRAHRASVARLFSRRKI